MNRREFINRLFTAGTLTALNPEIAIDQFLIETEKLSDVDFIDYVHYTMNLYVNNPAQCAIFIDIEEP